MSHCRVGNIRSLYLAFPVLTPLTVCDIIQNISAAKHTQYRIINANTTITDTDLQRPSLWVIFASNCLTDSVT